MKALTDIKGEHGQGIIAARGEGSAAGIACEPEAAGDMRGEDAARISSLMNKRREQRSVPKDREWVAIDDAAGLVAAESITPYPPGVPLIVEGEVMDEESIIWAKEFKAQGGKVLGITEDFRIKASKKRI